tara:strand:- start:81 stop:494 length:414 start_codon:yes stop_codon:yes gene_type:complete
MQKIYLIGFILSLINLLNAAEMSIDISEKIDISSDNIEIKEGKIKFIDNVIFQSKSYEVSGEVAEYFRDMDIIKIQGSPIEFSIKSGANNFNGLSNMILIKKNELEISGNVLIEDSSSRIRGEKVKFDLNSGKLQVN